MSDVTSHLGGRFFTTHGKNGMSECHENSEQSEVSGKARVSQKAEGGFVAGKVSRRWQRWDRATDLHHSDERTSEQKDNNESGDLRNAESLVARPFDAFDV